MIFLFFLIGSCYSFQLHAPSLVLNDIEFSMELVSNSSFHYSIYDVKYPNHSMASGFHRAYDKTMLSGLLFHTSGCHQLKIQGNKDIQYLTIHSMPGILSLTPPLVTILIAVIWKQVFIALICGIWLGAFYIHSFNPLIGLLRTFDTYFTQVINYQSGHAQVIVFCFLLGGLIGIIQKGGGAQSLAKCVTQFTTTRFKALLAVIGLNMLIFFDDYSAILIVGSTFTSIMKDLYISREKFAFIVHGISACFVSFMPISSWVGVEIGYIQDQIELREIKDPFAWFLQSIPYRFFPLLWLAFIVIIVLLQRDFGPMYHSELSCYQEGVAHHSRKLETGIEFSPMLKLGVSGDEDDQHRRIIPLTSSIDTSIPPVASHPVETGPLVPKPGTPLDRWYNAAIPFGVVVMTTFIGMYLDGLYALNATTPSTLINIFTHANSFNALMWGSMFGCMTALIMLIGQDILTLNEAMDAWVAGIAENILSPIIILLLAWALGQVISDVSASVYLAQSIGATLPVELLPCIVTILCFIMSFSTGTAFGSMGIMFPLVLPLAFQLGNQDETILTHCVGSILGGSLFGNVISPIADDSILCCMASSITVNAHVITMAPYVALVSCVSVFVGSIPVGYCWYGPEFALVLSILILTLTVMLFGRKVTETTSLYMRLKMKCCNIQQSHESRPLLHANQ